MSDSYTERDIHAQIARLARDLHSYEHSGKTIDTLLLAVTRQAVGMLDEVDHAGVTLVDRRGRVRSTAATGPVPTRIDELQDTHQQGPCLQTIREHITVRVKDFGSEERWPSFVEDLLAQTPVRSSLSVLLYTEDFELGALNLYAEEAGVLDDSVEDMAVALGAHAAIALSAARRSEQFHSALSTRDVIGQAKGIIMERYRIGSGAAFELLTRLSQDTNTPLAQIAQELVEADFPPADS